MGLLSASAYLVRVGAGHVELNTGPRYNLQSQKGITGIPQDRQAESKRKYTMLYMGFCFF